MRLQKKNTSTTPAKPLVIEPLDPTHEPSISCLIVRGELPLPFNALTAADAKFDELYVNFEREPSMMRVITKEADKVHVTCYAPELREWLKFTVPLNYPLHTDLKKLPDSKHPPKPEAVKAKNQEKAKHLKKFVKTKTVPAAEPASGKRVFKGKLGNKSVLIDIGDGSVVGEVADGVKLADAAGKLKREMVSQDKAGEFAMYVYTAAWQNARKAVKN